MGSSLGFGEVCKGYGSGALEARFIEIRASMMPGGMLRSLEKRDDGHSCIVRVILRPRIDFGGDGAPAPDVLHELHEQAHAMCFIANSVTTKVTVEETAPV